MLKTFFSFLSVLFLLFLWSSCQSDLEFTTNPGNLSFSKDTIYLDTVFTNIGSATHTLKVYNKSKEHITIPSISLGKKQNSLYRLNVDGSTAKSFKNIEIHAKDSLYIFIETTVDIHKQTDSTTFLYTDVLTFSGSAKDQEIPLITLVKDAVFLYPEKQADGSIAKIAVDPSDIENSEKVEGFYLKDTQLHFTAEKPYVIYGYAAVPKNKELIIDAGARVFFHKNSGILVTENAALQANGKASTPEIPLENEIIFTSDRLESTYQSIAGGWGSIWFSKNSAASSFTNTTIKNATVGIFTEQQNTPEKTAITLKNTKIYNSATHSIFSKNSSVKAQNTVFGNAGSSSVYINNGGEYHFTHTTIANYWNANFRSAPSLYLENSATHPIQAYFTNSIIDGSNNLEMQLVKNPERDFTLFFNHCAIGFNDFLKQYQDNALYNFDDATLYNSCIFNALLDYRDTKKEDFSIGDASQVKDNALLSSALEIPLDILEKDRSKNPSIGAYQSIIFDLKQDN